MSWVLLIGAKLDTPRWGKHVQNLREVDLVYRFEYPASQFDYALRTPVLKKIVVH